MKIEYVRFCMIKGYCRSGIPIANFESDEIIFGGKESKFAVLVLSQSEPETAEERIGEVGRSWDKAIVVRRAAIEIVPDIKSAMIIKLCKEVERDNRTLLIVDANNEFNGFRMVYGWAKASKGDPKQIFKSNEFTIWIMESGDEVEVHEADQNHRDGRLIKVEARE